MGRPPGWVAALTGRAVMRSPGRPPVRRDLERAFWSQIVKGLTSEDAAIACGVSAPVGTRWFRHAVGMPPIELTPVSPSPRARKLRCCEPRRSAYGKLRATSGGRRRRSRESCGATPPPEADRSSTAPLPLNGRPTSQRGARSRRSSQSTNGCESTCKTNLSDASMPKTEQWSPDRTSRDGKVGISLGVAIVGGRLPGVRSRSRIGCVSTFLTIRRCVSRTRRSTNRSISKDAADWSGSW